MSANDDLLDAFIRHQIFLLRVSGGIRNDVIRVLNLTEADVSALIRNMVLEGSTSVRLARAQAILRKIRAIRRDAWKQVNQEWNSSLAELAKQEAQFTAGAISATMPVVIDLTLPAADTLAALALNRPFEGRILRDWAADVAAADLQRIEDQIKIGIVQGESIQRIARRVVGTRALGGRDGVLQISRRNAEAITRTAVNSISNTARMEVFRRNADIITAEVFVATLDSRTTPICRSLDGKRFELGKGPIPPLHFSCRSLRVAEIDAEELVGQRPAKPATQRMLVREYAQRNRLGQISQRNTLPRGHKGPFDEYERRRLREIVGTVPAKTTYQEWLRRQSVEFQDDILGTTRGQLFRKGGLTLDRFVDSTGREIPIRELARMDAEAFRAAGIEV